MSKSVTIRIGYAESRIESGVLAPETTVAISEACSFEVQGAEHMMRSRRFGCKQWDGKKRLYHKGFRKFGTGLLSRVVQILEAHDYEVNLVPMDAESPEDVGFAATPMPPQWKERDYQRQAIRTAINEQRGMIKIATGGGKTVIAGHIIRALSVQTIFLVHTKDLLYQAWSTFRDMFGEDTVGMIGDGNIAPNYLTVCTLQTAARALEVDYEKDSHADGEDSWTDGDTNHTDPAIRATLEGAGLVFMDECHRVAAPTAAAVVSAIKNAPYRYGLSASPWRDDGADLQLEAIFGEVIVDIPASYLIERGFLVQPHIRMRVVPPGRFPKGTKYAQIYEQYIVNNDYRNKMVVDDAVSKIKRGLPTMVLTRQIAHGAHIASMMSEQLGYSVAFLSGKDDSSTRNTVIHSLREGCVRSLVATTIADEGLDIKPLAGLVLAGGGKSSTRALQRIGRVLRPFPGKKLAEVTDFEDNARYLLDHSKARVKMYESEPKFIII